MASLDLMREVVARVNSSPQIVAELKGSPRVFQFKLEGEKPFYVEIKADGTMELHEGEHRNPTSTLMARDDVMADIIQGKRDGVQAFFQGLLKISGDVMAVQKLAGILSRARR
ncbi:MAG: SCP2 sterol-binding domain-containing protein [Sulfolobales archaeon]